MRGRLTMALAALVALALAAPAEARTARLGHRMGMPHLHAPRLHKPKTSFRTVRVRRADGTVMTGYRDSLGTYLVGPDGRGIRCQRQVGGADIEIACR